MTVEQQVLRNIAKAERELRKVNKVNTEQRIEKSLAEAGIGTREDNPREPKPSLTLNMKWDRHTLLSVSIGLAIRLLKKNATGLNIRLTASGIMSFAGFNPIQIDEYTSYFKELTLKD